VLQNPIFRVVERCLYLVEKILAKSPPNGFSDRNATNGWLEILVGQSMTAFDEELLMTAWRSADEMNESHR
jgi:hypothetical protein